jgi:hypothetical protein
VTVWPSLSMNTLSRARPRPPIDMATLLFPNRPDIKAAENRDSTQPKLLSAVPRSLLGGLPILANASHCAVNDRLYAIPAEAEQMRCGPDGAGGPKELDGESVEEGEVRLRPRRVRGRSHRSRRANG